MDNPIPTKPPATKPFTVKQKKFIKAYVANNGNGTQAVLDAYDTKDPNTARAMAPEILAKPSVRQAIDKALEKHKITIDAAIKPIASGLKAGTSGYTDEEGKYHKGTPDHHIRLKASGMALKLLGAEQETNTGNTFNFVNVHTQEQNEFGI